MLNQIVCADCVQVLKEIPDNFVDLTITSPPYDNLRSYNGYSFDFESVARELYRVTKDKGIVVWIVNDATTKGSETGTSFKQALFFKEIGFNLHDTMIFKKSNPLPQEQHPRYRPSFEYMFIFCKGYPPKTFNALLVPNKNVGRSYTMKGQRTIENEHRHIQKKSRVVKPERVKDNVWEYEVGFGRMTSDKEAYKHPAIFPEQLAIDHILTWTNVDDVVLDPFGGSGTVVKAAKSLGRRFIHIDISEEYCEIARKRIYGG